MNFHRYFLARDNDNRYGKWLPALEEEFVMCNILVVTAGTTGTCGGDSGHGGQSFVKFHMTSGDMSVSADGNPFVDVEEVVISVGGDNELDTLIEGLRFAATALEAIQSTKCTLKEADQ